MLALSRILHYLIYTLYISRDFHSFILSILHSDTLLLVPFGLSLFLFGQSLCLFPTQLRGAYLTIVSYSLDIRSIFVGYSATHRLPSPTPFNAKIGFALFALSALFAKNVVSLCRFVAFLFFVRETVEAVETFAHISLIYKLLQSLIKVLKLQSSIFFLLLNSDIATLFMFFYPACVFFI